MSVQGVDERMINVYYYYYKARCLGTFQRYSFPRKRDGQTQRPSLNMDCLKSSTTLWGAGGNGGRGWQWYPRGGRAIPF